MGIENTSSQIENGQAPGGQQTTQIESAQAGPSSSVGSARHNGHTKARQHNKDSQPQRQAEQYGGG